MENNKTPAKKRWIIIFLILFVVLSGSMTGVYLYFVRGIFSPAERGKTKFTAEDEDLTSVRIFYPIEGRLQMEERTTERKISPITVAQATAEEFFKGPAGVSESYVPRGVAIKGLYFGIDGILYADLSDEMRSNFMGDAMMEFLLLRGLYESLAANVEGFKDIKVLIEGKETDTIGGHLSLLRPLGTSISNAALNRTGEGEEEVDKKQ